MNCNVIQDLLPLYVDSVLSEDSKALGEAHLATCPDCNAAREALKTELPEPAQPDISAKQAIATLSRLIKTRVKWGAVLAVLLTIALIGTGRFAFEQLFVINARYIPASAIQYQLARTEAGRVILGCEIDQNSFYESAWEGGTDIEDGQMVLYCAPQTSRLRWPFGNVINSVPSTFDTPVALGAKVENDKVLLVWDWNQDDDPDDTPLYKIYLGWGDDKKVIWQAGDPPPLLCTPEQQNWIRHFGDDADQSQDVDFG